MGEGKLTFTAWTAPSETRTPSRRPKTPVVPRADMGSSPEAGCGVADRFCVAVVVQLNESMNKAPVV